MFEKMQENSIQFIFIKDWMPTIITIFVGGIFAYIVVPIWQDRFNRVRSVLARKMDLAEEIASAFQHYVVCWRRLIQISTYEKTLDHGLDSDEKKIKIGFVEERNRSRDVLFEKLSVLNIHFSDSVQIVVEDFMRWDESKSIMELTELPPIGEWAAWNRKIISAIKLEINVK